MLGQPYISETTHLMVEYITFYMLLNLVSPEATNLSATAEGFCIGVWGHAFITGYNFALAFTSCFYKALR